MVNSLVLQFRVDDERPTISGLRVGGKVIWEKNDPMEWLYVGGPKWELVIRSPEPHTIQIWRREQGD